jgi:hypothetical protein
LTYDSDKLIAVSGLARELKPIMKSAYHSGLWSDHLIHQIAWKVTIPSPSPSPEADGTRGPSWSWAAVNGQVTMPYWDANPVIDIWILLADVVSAHTVPVTDDEFGHVKEGILRIHGSLGVLKLCGPVTEQSSAGDVKEGQDPLNKSGKVRLELNINVFWDTADLAKRYNHLSAPPVIFEYRCTMPTTVITKYTIYPPVSPGSSPNSLNDTENGGLYNEGDVFFLPIRISGNDPDTTYEIELRFRKEQSLIAHPSQANSIKKKLNV